jgi:hypothetical protein
MKSIFSNRISHMNQIENNKVIKNRAYSLIKKGICASQVALMFQQATLLLRSRI